VFFGTLVPIASRTILDDVHRNFVDLMAAGLA
jgi:hypothetical protein